MTNPDARATGEGGGGIQRLQTTDGFGCETARAIHKEVRAKSKPTAALLIDAVLPSVLRRFLIDEAGHVSSPLFSGSPYFFQILAGLSWMWPQAVGELWRSCFRV